jgi:amphi-Trp domain-containing protein
MSRSDRDLTRTYSQAQFVAKLRRLADSLESEKSFTIQVAGERLRIPAKVNFNIEHEQLATLTNWSSNCCGLGNDLWVRSENNLRHILPVQ